jgi:uncharacterized protein DUF5686
LFIIATLVCAAIPAQQPLPDTAGLRIITAAIARQHERRSSVHDYHYRAHVKFLLRDAASIAAITETLSEAYWQSPDDYQETILARRRLGNGDPERNLVAVGEIVNFNRDRVDLGRYSLVSPLADDALDSYQYRILDTLFRNDSPHRIYRLAIEPRTNASPLFIGIIDIADSTCDVVRIDVGVNDVVQFPFIANLHYRQSLRDVGQGHWMPYEIRLTGEIDVQLPVVHVRVPIPGFPRRGTFEQVAALTDFRFNEGHPPSDLGEVRVRLDKQADHADSAVWTAPDAIQLSATEHAAWARANSRRRGSPSVAERVRRVVETGRFITNGPDVHFNRVDGAYFGLHRTSRLPGVILDAKLGRAEATEAEQYRLGGQVRLWEPHQLWLGGSYYDETTGRSTFTERMPGDRMRGGGDDASALLFGRDRQDYYRARGYAITGSVRVLPFTRLDLQYTDESESSLPVATTYAVFPNRRSVRANPSIADGQLRSISATVTYDSRPVLRRLESDTRLFQASSTRITLTGERAFDFGRYSLQLERRQPTLGLGLTTLTVAGATTAGHVPPQREFGVNFGHRVGLGTVSDSNVYATRIALVTVHHDFGRRLFAKSGLPLTLAVDGESFWTQPSDNHFYRLGFQIGNLTPFLNPIDLGLRFDWRFFNSQRRFQVGISVQ